MDPKQPQSPELRSPSLEINSKLETRKPEPNFELGTRNSKLETVFDALLVVSFGGPEGMNDVIPFLENVLRGRNLPRERMLAVAEHYELFGGVSPINGQNQKLIAALREELESKGPRLPIYFGNRNWHPLLADTLRAMSDDGVKNALAFVTSAYSSYSSCRQYLENIAEAQQMVGSGAPPIDKLRAFYNHPLFIEANAENIRAALRNVPDSRRTSTQLVFTAHSIPEAMAEKCDYQAQLEETARLVAEQVDMESGHVERREGEAESVSNSRTVPYQMAYQSRSGPPSQSWLEPDVLDSLRALKEGGTTDVVAAPIGFISDHMEIIYDLDTQAKQLCDSIGLNLVRASTVGTHPKFVSMIRELILERMEPERERRFLGERGASPDLCPVGCCIRVISDQ